MFLTGFLQKLIFMTLEGSNCEIYQSKLLFTKGILTNALKYPKSFPQGTLNNIKVSFI